MFKRAIVAIVGIALLGSCASWREVKRGYTVGHVPCRAEEIETSNKSVDWQGATMVWEVNCKGETYACSQACQQLTLGGGCNQRAPTACSKVSP